MLFASLSCFRLVLELSPNIYRLLCLILGHIFINTLIHVTLLFLQIYVQVEISVLEFLVEIKAKVDVGLI